MFLAGLTWVVSATFSPVFAQTVFVTFDVRSVKAPGTYTFVFKTKAMDGTITEKNVTIKVDMDKDGKPTTTAAQVAMMIATQIGGAIDPSNASKVQYNLSASGNKGAGFSATSNNIIGFRTDIDNETAFLLPPNAPVGDVAFLPNPSNGSDLLATNSVITAGFASGLPPVTFDASAGEDLDQLASGLDSALKDGGYLTSMPDPTDVVCYAEGSSLPVEFDLEVEPLATVGSDGDIQAQLTTSIPEPATFALLLAGFGGLGLIRRNPRSIRPHAA
jgi:hypothetical protein